MATHLKKQTLSTTKEGIQLDRLACVNNPFIKGHTEGKEAFQKRFAEKPETCCKKCISIAKRLKIIE